MKARVLLRARSGPSIGTRHVMRTRAIAQALLARRVSPRIVVDDRASLHGLRAEGFDAALAVDELPIPCSELDAAWFDGPENWSATLEPLVDGGVRTVLVENRSAARERAWRSLYPSLHHRPDAWDATHAERVLAGARWIPFAREFSAQRPPPAREFDVLVTFGGTDPLALTERVVGALSPHAGRVLVTIGPHMLERRAAIERAGAHIPGLQLLAGSASLAPWMAASRLAITAVGTTLCELALLGTPALVLAAGPGHRGALAYYGEHGPHRPLGVATEMDEQALRGALLLGMARSRRRTMPAIEGLGDGAARVAHLLVTGEDAR